MKDDFEFYVKIVALKKAAIVMDTLATSMKHESPRNEAKELVRVISWAVKELEEKNANAK